MAKILSLRVSTQGPENFSMTGPSRPSRRDIMAGTSPRGPRSDTTAPCGRGIDRWTARWRDGKLATKSGSR
jgi:hypothetical protein